jgi:CDP-glucose 4,6-dehydratase
MKQFGNTYRGRSVLVTGSTGFKGSWLATWLCEMGAEVTGLALSPESAPNHWDLLDIPACDVRGDIRDLSVVVDTMEKSRPEIIFHLAAQSLVRRSYRDPLESWSTNVMGTANVLEACRRIPGIKAVVVITTDKVYANNEWPWGYRENDRLGGHDPYSASKAGSELVADSYRKSFYNTADSPLLATARAGNVIGGGDWSEDRLIPDLVRSSYAGHNLEIRSPYATRPWQHVLECLSGYLLLGEQLLAGRAEFSDAWNFGPPPDDNRTVADVLEGLKRHWSNLEWHTSSASQPHEAKLLYLDCAKARSALAWRPVLSLETSLAMTASWYQHFHATGKPLTLQQLRVYTEAAAVGGCCWIGP